MIGRCFALKSSLGDVCNRSRGSSRDFVKSSFLKRGAGKMVGTCPPLFHFLVNCWLLCIPPKRLRPSFGVSINSMLIFCPVVFERRLYCVLYQHVELKFHQEISTWLPTMWVCLARSTYLFERRIILSRACLCVIYVCALSIYPSFDLAEVLLRPCRPEQTDLPT